MSETFRFQCPGCGRKYKANKDLSGRLKRCGKCRRTFPIAEAAPVRKGSPAPAPPPARMGPDPELPIDEVFTALAEWQKRARSLPRSFAREVTFGHFEPAYRLTLEVTIEERGRRAVSKAHRETAPLPPELADEARRAARPIADLPFEHSAEVLDRLSGKPPEVRRAAEQLVHELRPPEGGRFVGRRLEVEHLPAWKATWVFHEREGTVWFYGRPLRVFLPDPPRRSAWPAAAAILLTLAAVGAAVWAARELDLLSPPPETAAQVPTPPPTRPRTEPLPFARDGVILLDDGTFLRGALERKDDSVVVQANGQSQPVPTWRIETLHPDAPVFIRGESRRLDDLGTRVKSAREARPPPARETLVGLFLELHRQRDRWARLEALCSPSELPLDLGPRKRLETLQVEIEKLLEKTEPIAAAAPAIASESAPRAPEPPPAAALAVKLLAEMGGATDAEARRRLAGGFQALRGEKIPQADLLHFAYLYLSRSEFDAGLAIDRVHLRTPQVDSTFEGTLEKRGESFVQLRTPLGQEVTAYREKDAWVAQIPGGVRIEGAQCTATPAAPTASGERLRGAFERLPPFRWMTASGGDHLRAAKAAAESLVKKGAAAGDRGLVLLRYLAAAHATTALRTGTPAEILEARGVLHGLGYAPTTEGRWERPEDRRAAQLGQLIRGSRAQEARSLLPGPRVAQDFFGGYRTLAAEIQAPMRGREDVDRVFAALDQALGQALTASEGRHLQALKTAVAGFGVCSQCGGNAARLCSTCRGKGQRTEACAACRGLGYITTVGIGATGAKTCEACQGRPIRGTRPCERCEGKGTRSCPKCQGVTRLPVPTDLGRTASCGRCGGTGGHGDLALFSCPSCAGLGVQLLPAGAPDATLP